MSLKDKPRSIASAAPREVEAWISPKFRITVPVEANETLESVRCRIESTFSHHLGHSVHVRALLDCNFNDLPPMAPVELMVRDGDRVYVLLDRNSKTTWYSSYSDRPPSKSDAMRRIQKEFKRVFDACEDLGGPCTVQEVLQARTRMDAARVRASWSRAGSVVAQMIAAAREIDRLSGVTMNGRCKIEIRHALESLRDGVVLLPDVAQGVTSALLRPPSGAQFTVPSRRPAIHPIDDVKRPSKRLKTENNVAPPPLPKKVDKSPQLISSDPPPPSPPPKRSPPEREIGFPGPDRKIVD